MAKLAYPFVRGLVGKIAIFDRANIYAKGNAGDANDGTIQVNTEYVFDGGIVCAFNGDTIYTQCNFTRINGDVWEVRNDGFYIASTKYVNRYAGMPLTVLFIVKENGNYYLTKSEILSAGFQLTYWNGNNCDGYAFTTDLGLWGRAIKFMAMPNDHTGYIRCNNSWGGQTVYHFMDYGMNHSTVLQLTFDSTELYEFAPYGYNSNNDPLGGDEGSNDPSGDSIEMPPDPDETISGTLCNGFLNIYAPSDSDLRGFGGALWTNAFNTKWYDLDSVANLILNTISDPINFIIGLFMLPVSPATGSATGIYLGGINVNTVSAPRITKQFKTISFGSLTIDELYSNYLDYAGSRLSIYLPYIGTADLDVQEVNGGSVELEYKVDCFTGACVANVRCVKSTKTPWGMTYKNETVHSYSGNLAIQLPISAGSFDTMTQGLINIGLGLGTNTPAIAMQGATNALHGLGGDVTTRGALSSNTGKLCYQTPYLMFTRPIESRPASLGDLHGYSAGAGGKLKNFSGYVECSDVKLEGVTATDTELDMIESLLKSGVYV